MCILLYSGMSRPTSLQDLSAIRKGIVEGRSLRALWTATRKIRIQIQNSDERAYGFPHASTCRDRSPSINFSEIRDFSLWVKFAQEQIGIQLQIPFSKLSAEEWDEISIRHFIFPLVRRVYIYICIPLISSLFSNVVSTNGPRAL